MYTMKKEGRKEEKQKRETMNEGNGVCCSTAHIQRTKMQRSG